MPDYVPDFEPKTPKDEAPYIPSFNKSGVGGGDKTLGEFLQGVIESPGEMPAGVNPKKVSTWPLLPSGIVGDREGNPIKGSYLSKEEKGAVPVFSFVPDPDLSSNHGFRWKWHLPGPCDLRDPVNYEIAKFLMEEGIQFKVGYGNEEGMGICAYVGSYDKSMALAEKLISHLDDLGMEIPPLQASDTTDIQLVGNVYARFEVPESFTQYNCRLSNGPLWWRYGDAISPLCASKYKGSGPSAGGPIEDCMQNALHHLSAHAGYVDLLGEYYHGKDPEAYFTKLLDHFGCKRLRGLGQMVMVSSTGERFDYTKIAAYGRGILQARANEPLMIELIENLQKRPSPKFESVAQPAPPAG